MNNTEKIIKEITEFHQNIEKWFQGRTDHQEILYQQLLSGFSPGFTMINGDGKSVTLSNFSDWLPTTFGKFPDRIVQVQNIEVQHSDHHGLATYIETQTTGGITNKRKSSAVFLVNEEKAFWLHLTENWL